MYTYRTRWYTPVQSINKWSSFVFLIFLWPSLPPPAPPSVFLPNRNPSAGINKIELCVAHQLLAAATDDGFVHLWDARQGQSGGGRGVACLDLRDAVGAAAVNAAEQTLGGFQVGWTDTQGQTTWWAGRRSKQCCTVL